MKPLRIRQAAHLKGGGARYLLLSHHEREVIVEWGETEGYPDYNFRVGGQTKFFVEAKAPPEPARFGRLPFRGSSIASETGWRGLQWQSKHHMSGI
jgi:hypothetical protein